MLGCNQGHHITDYPNQVPLAVQGNWIDVCAGTTDPNQDCPSKPDCQRACTWPSYKTLPTWWLRSDLEAVSCATRPQRNRVQSGFQLVTLQRCSRTCTLADRTQEEEKDSPGAKGSEFPWSEMDTKHHKRANSLPHVLSIHSMFY